MGAWGCGVFDNDDALDWVSALSEAPDAELVRSTLEIVEAAGEDYLESPESCEALAAAAVLAAWNGKADPGLPTQAAAWVQGRGGASPPPEWLDLARRSAARVRDQSELRELWEESADFLKWRAAVDALLARLAD